MRYLGEEAAEAPDLNNKQALREIIANTDWEFTRSELEQIIHNEFFNDDNPLDAGLVDVAVARLLLLDGIELNEDAMQRERERMIYGVLKQIFKK